MSGGGSETYMTDFARNSDVTACELLSVETTICNPNEALLSKIKVGDVLVVSQEEDDELCVKDGVNIIGDLNVPNKDNFIECLKEGTFYVAEVLSNKDGICKVMVKSQHL